MPASTAFPCTPTPMCQPIAAMSSVGSRAGAVVSGPGSSCCRRLSPSAGASVRPVTPFPASATSHAACGFPTLRAPARFAPRLMRPITLRALSTVAAWVARHDRSRTGPNSCTATAYSTSSSRSPLVAGHVPGDVGSAFLPSHAHTRNSGWHGRRQSNSPSLVATDWSAGSPARWARNASYGRWL